jgi:hypothetical protein
MVVLPAPGRPVIKMTAGLGSFDMVLDLTMKPQR